MFSRKTIKKLQKLNAKKSLFFIVGLSILFLVTGVVITVHTDNKLASYAAVSAVQPVGQTTNNWNMIFSDEFNGTSVDLTKWRPNWLGSSDTSLTPPINSAETSCYDPAQVKEANGEIDFTAITSSCSVNGKTYKYRSGMVESDGKFNFTYGYFEARMWTPAGTGVWPAFWATGQNWPTDGEIDVDEAYGTDESTFHFHYLGCGGDCGPGGSSIVSGATSGWHTYAADWEPGVITWYYDGRQVWQYTTNVTASPLYLVLNLALNSTQAAVPATLKVDYVRVWQKCTSNCTVPTATKAPTNTPVPPTPTSTPVPTTRPTSTPIPTPTLIPSSTTFNVTLLLHGLGNSGDNTNPVGKGNMTPIHPQRTVTVDVYDTQNNLVLSRQGTTQFDAASGSFKGTVDMGTSLVTGFYTVKIKSGQYLRGQVPGIISVTSGHPVTLTQLALTTGDINGDNAVNILDYNILMSCYADFSAAPNCAAGDTVRADITDDGAVNQFDYNLFMRELNATRGQ